MHAMIVDNPRCFDSWLETSLLSSFSALEGVRAGGAVLELDYRMRVLLAVVIIGWER